MYGSQEGFDCTRRIPQARVAITAFLIQKTEPRVALLQALQCCQGVRDPVEAPLVGAGQVEGVAILRCRNRKRFGCRERLRVSAGFA